MARQPNDAVLLIGRLLLALIFILSGFNKITGFSGTAQYMASAGVPAAQVLLVPAIIVELGAGLLLAIGYKAHWAALAIFGFVLIVTFVFHPFWAVEPDQAQNQMHHFMKNLAIMGGMLYVWMFGSGAYSVDGRQTEGIAHAPGAR